jgi:hypothetical protein
MVEWLGIYVERRLDAERWVRGGRSARHYTRKPIGTIKREYSNMGTLGGFPSPQPQPPPSSPLAALGLARWSAAARAKAKPEEVAGWAGRSRGPAKRMLPTRLDLSQPLRTTQHLLGMGRCLRGHRRAA